MVFKVIDGNLTSIFKKTQNIADGFNIASNSISLYANAFNRLNAQQNFGARWDTFLSGMDKANPKLVTYFQDLAKQGASARASIQDMYAVLLDGNTRGIGNVKSVISAFNQVNPANQQAFAQAVGQTNAQLGIYLSNLNGAKASMSGYASSLVATTAKTIALKTASMILNGALSAVVSLIIGGAITAVTKFINAQEEARQKALELAQSHEGNIERLQELKQEYLDIIDSTDSESKKNEELIEWKKKLIQQYGFEKQALEDVNGVRQTGIDLMNEEMVKEAEQTIADLGDTYDQAYEKMYNKSWRFSRQDKGLAFYDMSFFEEMLKKYGITIDKLSTTTVDMSGAMQTNTFSKINIDAKNTTDTLEKLASALADFRSMSEDPLTKNKAELRTLINELQKEYDEVKETSDKYSTIVEQGLNAKAVKKFYTYIAKDGNRITEITEDNFETWKTGLLETAEADEPLKKALTEMADEYCPNMVNGVNNTVTSVTALNDALTKLQEILNDIKSAFSVYQSAMKKVTAGVGLTADEVNEMLELDPTLFDKFIKQKDGTWTIDLGALQASYEVEFVQKNKDDLGIDKQQVQKERNSLSARLDELYKKREEILNDSVVDVRDANDKPGEKSAWQKKREEEIKNINSQISEVEKQLDETDKKLVLSSFQELLFDYSDADRIRDSYDEVVKKIDEYNDGITKINKAIESATDTATTGSQELDKFNVEMQKTYGLGNVDLTTRPKVELDDGSIATVLSGLEYLWQGDEENGQYVGVHITPILPNGEVLSDDELSDYIQNVLTDTDDILKADKVENGGKGLVLKIDTGLNLSESDIASLNSDGELTDHMQEVLTTADEWDNKLHEVQAQWLDLDNTVNKVSGTAIISYDDMTELIQLYPELVDKFKETPEGYAIEVQALEEVRTQSYKTRNDYIDDRTAEVAALREDVKQQIEEYKRLAIARIVSENSHGNYVATVDELLENDPEYQALLLKLELYDEYFNKVVGYKRTVTGNGNSGSSDKSVTDALQNQIDYYSTLLEAIGIVSDKVVEGLEKEKDAIDQKIDALNDEKDALQEKNDEQQRELDLIEAKNNLDKAKKQKVFVYKEGQGLVQIQDEKAVADAQKEYDDIQKEIEIANIDKQIDVYEKQKEAIEDQIDAQQKYGEQFTNMESDIKDTLTVEQAKKALGTDEKGLLSLDDKTITGIRDGLATATYNKDVEDNKKNSEYVTVKLEDFLKSVGATVTPTEFKAMASTITNNPANIIPATNANSTINNAQTINNKTANFNATFNIYDALDPHKIIDTVKEYFNGVLKQTINSVK